MGRIADELVIRAPRQGDVGYISKCWKESFYAFGLVSWAPKFAYFAEMDKRVPDLLARSRVLVAANPADDDHIIGWVCGSPPVVHYVYVRREYQNKRVATRLLRELGIGAGQVFASHWTRPAETLFEKPGVVYAPLAIEESYRAAS